MVDNRNFFCLSFKISLSRKNVVIIENDSELGGLLKSNVTKSIFDLVHTFYETGIQFIDDFFIENQPDSGWNFLNGYER